MSFLAWLGLRPNGEPLESGDDAPGASACDEEGTEVNLADYYHDGFTLVYFYPKADTPGCTAQACNLRDAFTVLCERNIRVIGVSTDKSAAQLRFKTKYKLPFTLLADPDRVVAKAFGVPLMLGMTHRQSFLIKGTRIVWRDLHASPRTQARDILDAIEKLS